MVKRLIALVHLIIFSVSLISAQTNMEDHPTMVPFPTPRPPITSKSVTPQRPRIFVASEIPKSAVIIKTIAKSTPSVKPDSVNKMTKTVATKKKSIKAKPVSTKKKAVVAKSKVKTTAKAKTTVAAKPKTASTKPKTVVIQSKSVATQSKVVTIPPKTITTEQTVIVPKKSVQVSPKSVVLVPQTSAPMSFNREMLTSVNALRQSGTNCGGVQMPPVRPLAWNVRLAQAADVHVTDMAAHENFSHIGTNGSKPDDRIQSTGYNWERVGENIGMGYKNIASAIKGWQESSNHCKQMMSADITEMGAAQRGKYWCQNFAKPFD